jgi:hypothetical protein
MVGILDIEKGLLMEMPGNKVTILQAILAEYDPYSDEEPSEEVEMGADYIDNLKGTLELSIWRPLPSDTKAPLIMAGLP